MKKIIRIILLIILICFMCYFSYNIYNYLSEEKANEKLNEDLIDIAITTTEIEIGQDNDNINEMPIEVNFEVLKQKNSDIVGWIYLENSPINFPVVQGKDNDYYLRRLIDGTYNSAGTIFMDYRNDKNMNDWNTIIYGHNMKNSTMFGTLLNYKEQSYYDEHKIMYYITENKKYEVELIAGYTESSDNIIYNISNNEYMKDKILEFAKNKSTFKSNVEINAEDKILTLSTCSYDFDEARYILMGILNEL